MNVYGHRDEDDSQTIRDAMERAHRTLLDCSSDPVAAFWLPPTELADSASDR